MDYHYFLLWASAAALAYMAALPESDLLPAHPPKNTASLSDLSLFSQQLLFSCLVMPDSLQPHGLQHARLLCPLLSPGVCSDSCPSSRWCCPTTHPQKKLTGWFKQERNVFKGGSVVSCTTRKPEDPNSRSLWLETKAPDSTQRSSAKHFFPLLLLLGNNFPA